MFVFFHLDTYIKGLKKNDNRSRKLAEGPHFSVLQCKRGFSSDRCTPRAPSADPL